MIRINEWNLSRECLYKYSIKFHGHGSQRELVLLFCYYAKLLLLLGTTSLLEASFAAAVMLYFLFFIFHLSSSHFVLHSWNKASFHSPLLALRYISFSTVKQQFILTDC